MEIKENEDLGRIADDNIAQPFCKLCAQPVKLPWQVYCSRECQDDWNKSQFKKGTKWHTSQNMLNWAKRFFQARR
jgi:hypothetical protein